MGTQVVVERDGPVLRIELDGPDRLNAIGSGTYRGIAEALRALRPGGEVRAVVISGRGRGFCAGADLEEIRTYDAAGFGTFIHGFTDALDVVETTGVPVVAAIHGLALGGGLELALACHLRVSTPTAKLGVPEIKLGVLPGAGGTQRLPNLVPRPLALELLLLGDPISGQRAYDLGLVNVLAEDPVAAALALAQRLAAGPPLAQAAAIDLLGRTATMSVADGIALERATGVELFGTADGREGFAAFAEKRPPVFRGQA
ncbi:enoyl-CoA hydratase/isomerase family protein [Sporichthya sp.]|uniref:enoyl-CoA hydratase/isomerase family protein n=1 Tax=Sporichthya sp. TaxID=65475 RepID=UPI0017ADEBA1|nr:enoyl-CoA hydratase/isomerase family protein [Sporichthya sp.]MBA3742966.1 enoyl-CoA hydratase/isomerase family protein [Sporichthya sp.]